jgi:sulfite reductase (NADPH) hemoprotein beta-component
VSIGGRQGKDAALGDVIGPSFAASEVPDVIEKLVETYVDHRREGERFVDTVQRIGIAPFKARVYGAEKETAHA